MNQLENNIQNEMTMLYELSMATGTHIDLKENCNHFIRILKSRKNLTAVGLWIYTKKMNPDTTGNIKLITSVPQVLFKNDYIKEEHKLIEYLQHKPYIVLPPIPEWADIIGASKTKKDPGHLALFRLSHIGFISMFSYRTGSPFTDSFMKKMSGVIRKMAVTIEGSLAHGKSLKEIEQRKLVEQKLNKMNENLEQMIIQRTEALNQAQLAMIHQEKLASIGQLAAGVAHELNNPIGFISSNFQVLQKYTEILNNFVQQIQDAINTNKDPAHETPAIKELSNNITAIRKKYKISFIFKDIESIFEESEEGFQRVISIVNNLRSFSRIDAESEMEISNLNDGITSTLVVANNEIKYVSEIELDLKDIPSIECNAGEINQVLLNIIINAAQVIKSDESEQRGLITIKTWSKKESVFCSVEDTGSGIPEKNMNQIFNPFFSTKAPGEGTGLGLHISYNIIVNKHHGTLVAKNTGNGAKFTLSLPIKQKKGDADV